MEVIFFIGFVLIAAVMIYMVYFFIKHPLSFLLALIGISIFDGDDC